MTIKTRFAPSPTGNFHIGVARTALYSWLFARNKGGKFILRIEDTDINRSNKKYIDSIIDSMNWLKLDWDEGPYFQSNRFDRYNQIIDYMLTKGSAYRCFCSKERLQYLREMQIRQGKKPRYDGYCRFNNKKNYNDEKKSFVVRFLNPKEGSVIFTDEVRGILKFNNHELDDLIICRTDGSPTYNFCVAIDDADMGITHVIRGEDHISNTPRQINILKALDSSLPKYAHLSIILGNDGKKLSKRHSSMEIMEYRNDGFLPEALLNYLVRLGWSHGNQEIFSIQQMKNLFNLKSISKSSSTFDIEKLIWLNHYYMNHLPVEDVANYLASYIKSQMINIHMEKKLPDLIKLVSKRYNTLKEIMIECRYFYQNSIEFDNSIYKKFCDKKILPYMKDLHKRLSFLKIWTPESIHLSIIDTSKKFNINISEITMPLRIAITGSIKSPAISDVVYAIGQLRSLERIDIALDYLSGL